MKVFLQEKVNSKNKSELILTQFKIFMFAKKFKKIDET